MIVKARKDGKQRMNKNTFTYTKHNPCLKCLLMSNLWFKECAVMREECSSISQGTEAGTEIWVEN